MVGSTKKRKADKVAATSAETPPSTKQTSSSKKKIRCTTSITVNVSPNNPDYDPIVVSFPRGVPNSIVVASSSTTTNNYVHHHHLPQFTCSKLKATSSRGRRITGEDSSCTYTASAAGRGHDGRLTKTYVCIYNKKQKTLKLIPSAEKGTVFSLEQSVKEYTPNVVNGTLIVGSGNQTVNDGDNTATKVLSASDQVQRMVESFGSKKKQKVMASRQANKVNIHSVIGTGELMMKSVEKQEGISLENKKKMVEEGGSKMANPNEVAYETARKRMLPPFDSNANAPSKVYNAQQFFGNVAWDKVSRIVDKVLEMKDGNKITDWTTTLLGKKSVHQQPSIVALLKTIDPTQKGSPYRIKTAFLLFLLLKLHHRISRNRSNAEGATAPSLEDSINSIHIPHEVGVVFFDLFTSPTNNNMFTSSKLQKDRLNAYLFILYVIASGRDMKVPSINPLCKDMRIDIKDASAVLREAGFAVKKNGVGDVGVSLNVPLKFPPPKRSRK